MKYLTLLLLLPIFLSCDQSNNDVEIPSNEIINKTVLISGHSPSNKCSRKAIRITDNKVEFDDCYDEDNQTFNSNRSIELSNKSLYSSILNTSVEHWRMIEANIDNVANIDAGLPFVVDITSNGNTNSIILLRISHYNEHDKSFMNEIETIFDNWDLLMSHITTNKQH